MLVFSALALTMLMGIGGFAVDLGNWYLHASRLQKTADSAALAGAVFLPGDVTKARTAAFDAANRNATFAYRTEVTQSPNSPTVLKVSVSEEVQNIFVPLFGLETLDMSRTATGEYSPYVPMGSPSNVLGVEPDSANRWEKAVTAGLQSRYWLNIVGGQTPKANGDRYSGGNCSQTADRCNSGAPFPTGNTDYSADGQVYVVRIPAGTTGNLEIQAFDPGFSHVGDNCTEATLDGAQAFNPPGTTLYDKGNTNRACTGDQSTDWSRPAPHTTYTLYTPLDSAGGSKKVTSTQCQGTTFPGYKGQVVDKLDWRKPSYDPVYASWFRKWTPVCRLYVGTTFPAGDYLLRVNTDLNSNGLNRFGLRAAMMAGGNPDAAATANISLFSKGRLVIYARENSGAVTFYTARIHSGAAGKDLTITLFDIGDAAGGASLKVLPPTDAKTGTTALTSFSNCTYTPPSSTTYQATANGCAITGMSSGSYNGRLTNVRVPIPSGYRCDDTKPEGCWVRLALTYGAGTVSDTTSWQVSLNGSPVRLAANE